MTIRIPSVVSGAERRIAYEASLVYVQDFLLNCYPVMSLKWSLGAIAFVCSMTSISLNMLIFMPVFRLAFISKKSTVYIIAFFNIISDLSQTLVIGFYLAPSIMADVSGTKWSTFIEILYSEICVDGSG